MDLEQGDNSYLLELRGQITLFIARLGQLYKYCGPRKIQPILTEKVDSDIRTGLNSKINYSVANINCNVFFNDADISYIDSASRSWRCHRDANVRRRLIQTFIRGIIASKNLFHGSPSSWNIVVWQ